MGESRGDEDPIKWIAMEEGQFGCGAKKRCIESFDDGIQLIGN